MTFLYTYIAYVVFTLLCAGKDATSYLQKNHSANGPLDNKRIKRWHRDGAAIWAMFAIAVAMLTPVFWWTLLQALLIRVATYDLGFNKWAKLPIEFLGSSAFWDRVFIFFFGLHGAVRKGGFFFIASVVCTYLIIKNL